MHTNSGMLNMHTQTQIMTASITKYKTRLEHHGCYDSKIRSAFHCHERRRKESLRQH